MRRTRLAVLPLAVGAGPISPRQPPELPLENCGDRASLTVAVLGESGTIPLPGDSIVLPIAIGGADARCGALVIWTK